MKIYRGCKNSDVFTGAHFTDCPKEAQAYTEISTDGDCFGGEVRVYKSSFSIDEHLVIESMGDAINAICACLADGHFEVSDLPGAVAKRIKKQWEVEFGEYDFDIEDYRDIDGSGIAIDVSGFYQHVYELLEQTPLFDALAKSDYQWVEFREPSVRDDKTQEMSTTYRYLGGGSVELA